MFEQFLENAINIEMFISFTLSSICTKTNLISCFCFPLQTGISYRNHKKTIGIKWYKGNYFTAEHIVKQTVEKGGHIAQCWKPYVAGSKFSL